jgi:hypothetical protein
MLVYICTRSTIEASTLDANKGLHQKAQKVRIDQHLLMIEWMTNDQPVSCFVGLIEREQEERHLRIGQIKTGKRMVGVAIPVMIDHSLLIPSLQRIPVQDRSHVLTRH